MYTDGPARAGGVWSLEAGGGGGGSLTGGFVCCLSEAARCLVVQLLAPDFRLEHAAAPQKAEYESARRTSPMPPGHQQRGVATLERTVLTVWQVGGPLQEGRPAVAACVGVRSSSPTTSRRTPPLETGRGALRLGWQGVGARMFRAGGHLRPAWAPQPGWKPRYNTAWGARRPLIRCFD